MRVECPQLHKGAVSEAEAGPGEQWGRKTEASVIVGWCASSMALPTSDALFAPRYLLFCPLPLCTWAPGCISLGYSAFSATNTALSISNLYKK